MPDSLAPLHPASLDPRAVLQANARRLAAARFLLVLMIVYFHVPLPDLQGAEPAEAMRLVFFANATLLRFSVSMLTLISGFIFFGTLGDADPPRAIRRKAASVLVPFLAWSVPVALLVWAAQSAGLFRGFRLYLPGADLRTWLDALLAWSGQPVNYPLYFLRDLFVIFVIAALTGKWFRRYLISGLLIVLIVYQYDLDRGLVLRNDMLLSFFAGGAVAISRTDPNRLDRHAWLMLALLLGLCLVHYLLVGLDSSNESLLVLRVVAIACTWPAISLLGGTRLEAVFSGLGRYAFPVFLIHGPILALLVALGAQLPNTNAGFVLWLLSSPAIVLLSIAAFVAMRSVAPRLMAVTSGGRDG